MNSFSLALQPPITKTVPEFFLAIVNAFTASAQRYSWQHDGYRWQKRTQFHRSVGELPVEGGVRVTTEIDDRLRELLNSLPKLVYQLT